MMKLAMRGIDLRSYKSRRLFFYSISGCLLLSFIYTAISPRGYEASLILPVPGGNAASVEYWTEAQRQQLPLLLRSKINGGIIDSLDLRVGYYRSGWLKRQELGDDERPVRVIPLKISLTEPAVLAIRRIDNTYFDLEEKGKHYVFKYGAPVLVTGLTFVVQDRRRSRGGKEQVSAVVCDDRTARSGLDQAAQWILTDRSALVLRVRQDDPLRTRDLALRLWRLLAQQLAVEPDAALADVSKQITATQADLLRLKQLAATTKRERYQAQIEREAKVKLYFSLLQQQQALKARSRTSQQAFERPEITVVPAGMTPALVWLTGLLAGIALPVLAGYFWQTDQQS